MIDDVSLDTHRGLSVEFVLRHNYGGNYFVHTMNCCCFDKRCKASIIRMTIYSDDCYLLSPCADSDLVACAEHVLKTSNHSALEGLRKTGCTRVDGHDGHLKLHLAE